MKHRLTKNLLTRLIICTLLFVTAFAINSCRKDVQKEVPSKSTLTLTKKGIDINKLKTAYNNGINLNKLKIADISQQTFANIIGSLTVDWTSYTLTTYPDSTQIIEFVMPDDSTLVVPGSLTLHDTLKYHPKTSAVFILRKDTINMSFFMKTIEDCTAPGYQSVIGSVLYNQEPSTFNGNVFYFTLARQYINGYHWLNGNPNKTLSLGSSSSPPQVNKNGKPKINTVAATVCLTEVYGVYNVTEDSSGNITSWQNQVGTITVTTCDIIDDGGSGGSGGSGTGGGSGGGAAGTVTPPKPCPTANNSVSYSKGHLKVNVVQNPPGSGGSTGTTTPCSVVVSTSTTDITNNVKNPCLKAMLQATISANIKTKINALIQGIFGSSTKMNLNFVDVSTLPVNADAYTNLNGGLVNSTLNAQVQLDNNHLPNYSQQYIARVIMHEALHAYLASIGTSESQQHESMMVNYVTQMATSLQQMFPGLSDLDAKNLALGGLQLSTTFQNTIEKDMGLLGTFVATNIAYSSGSAGLRCNF